MSTIELLLEPRARTKRTCTGPKNGESMDNQWVVAILHQGQPGHSAPTIANAWTLQADLTEALRERGWQPQAVFLDTQFLWLQTLLQMAPQLVLNAADLGFFYDMTLEPIVPGVLAAAGLHFTGTGAYAEAFSSDKFASKLYLQSLGVAVPEVWLADADPHTVTYPVIVKPRFGHNSYGMDADCVVRDAQALRRYMAKVPANAPDLLLEAFIDGPEVTAAFVGHQPSVALPIFRVDFGPAFANQPKILGYRSKWIEDSPEYLDSPTVPAQLPEELRDRVDAAMAKATQALLICDYGRGDFRLRTLDDGQVEPVLVDYNANPDLSRGAGLARMAGVAGWTYAELIDRIVQSALARPPHRPVVDAAQGDVATPAS